MDEEQNKKPENERETATETLSYLTWCGAELSVEITPSDKKKEEKE